MATTTLTLISLLLCLSASACELLVEARNRNISTNDYGGRARLGMVITIKPDGWPWGLKERPSSNTNRYCAVIKIPEVPVSKALKYTEILVENNVVTSYRLWRIRWADLPAAARNKLRDTGTLTIKATEAHTGTYDYTWNQVKGYFRNLATSDDETEDL